MRQAEFRAVVSQAEWKKLRQRKPSARLVSGVLAITLAWVVSAIGLGPSQLQFGHVQIGASSSLPVQITNRGMTEFHAASVALEGEDAKDFDVDTKRCDIVAVGESCALWVDFRPRRSGPKHARLVVRATDGKEFSSDFTGDAMPGKVVPLQSHEPPLQPPAHAAPSVPDPHPPTDKISDHATDPAPPPAPVHYHEPPHVPDSPAPRNPSPPPSQPAVPSSPPSVPVPTRPGLPPIVFPAPGNPPPVTPPAPKPVPRPLPHLTMTPGTAKFTNSSNDGEFYASPTQTVIVRSDGAADIRQLRLRVSPSGVFNYSTDCRISLAHGQACKVQVKFTPRDTRSYAGTITAYEFGTQMAMVTLQGDSRAPPAHPHLTVNPSSVQFGDVWPPTRLFNSPPQALVLRNDGTADLRQLNLKIDPSAAPFIYSSQCPAFLARGQSCTVLVRFAPRDSRQYAGTLIASEGGTQLAAANLRGGGTSSSPPPKTVGNGTTGGVPPVVGPGPGQGGRTNGVPPQGPVVGKVGPSLVPGNSPNSDSNHAAAPPLTNYKWRVGIPPGGNGGAGSSPTLTVPPGNVVVRNGGSAVDIVGNRGTPRSAPANTGVQLPKAPAPPTLPKTMVPKPPDPRAQRSTRRPPSR